MDCSDVMQVDRVCYTMVVDTPYNYLVTIQNPAVYLSVQGLAFFSTLVPQLYYKLDSFSTMAYNG